MKCYFFLPLVCFWLNEGLNHSHSSPAVMSWEWSQDMVLTLEVPACTPSHLPLSPWLLFWCRTVSDHFKRTENVKRIHLWRAPACLTQTASSPERSASLEVRIPAALRSAFAPPERGFSWLLPNHYFSLSLIPITDVPPCAGPGEIPVVSPKASWLGHKRNKSDTLVPSLNGPPANLCLWEAGA